MQALALTTKTYPADTAVDVVVIGSGPAGGSVARELTRKGFDVVVLEQGTAFEPEDMEHDEIGAFVTSRWTSKAEWQSQTYRKTVDEVAKKRQYVSYARAVGSTTFHFTGNYWRFRPIDFHELSVRGGVPGAAMANWPITYEELEPFHTAVEYAVGVSGETSHAPGEPMRSKPYPLPPINVHGPGVLLEVGAKKLGWSSKAAPMAILSRPYRGRRRRRHEHRRADQGRTWQHRAPAGHGADGQRPEVIGGGQVPPRPRREEPLHRRRKHLRHERPRTADHDDPGACLPCGRPHRPVRETTRDLTWLGVRAYGNSSFPRRRESMFSATKWIPAFAGMTNECKYRLPGRH
jgi:choline dehydrogenase-like flavoprotein